MNERSKPILCLDFDGVIHDYRKGWQDGSIYGDVTPGFWEWAIEAQKHFKLVVYSSRSRDDKQYAAMCRWMLDKFMDWKMRIPGTAVGDMIMNIPSFQHEWFEFAHEKPPAFLTIDDRALTFNGDWVQYNPESLIGFTPWMTGAKRKPVEMVTEPQIDKYTTEGFNAAQGGPDANAYSVAWAVERWRAEVENRPLVNKSRRALDDTWRQVIRHFGGDADKLLGPSHDELVEKHPEMFKDSEIYKV